MQHKRSLILTVLALLMGPAQGAQLAAPSTAQSDDDRVAAGCVAWHPTLEAARAAAEISGRPVLQFQLLGRLDERFC